VRYLVFELPQAPGTFRQRALALRELTTTLALPWLQAVEQWEFGSRQALDEKLELGVSRAGGEGLMLHRADALYVTGRSDVLLKLKLWRDAEATVIGHQPGRGKYAGMLGALRVRTDRWRRVPARQRLQRRRPSPAATDRQPDYLPLS
jgi:DNA ligase-1